MNIMMLLMTALYAVANAQPKEEYPSDMQKRGSISCKTKICGLNEDYRLCNDTYREDMCIPCPPNTFNLYNINRSQEYYGNHGQHQNVCKKATEICVNTTCLEEATINLDECLRTGKVTCECDRSRGFCGEDPRTCRPWRGNVTELKKGIELTPNCQLKKCNDGNFKDKEGYGKCHKHRECSNGEMIISNGTRTMNTQCSTSNGTQSKTTNTDVSNVNSTVGNSSTPISPNDKGNTVHVSIVIGVILGIIVFIAIIVRIIYICWHRKQRGRDNHRNGFSANSGDLRQNEEMSEMREMMIPNGSHAA